MEILRLSEAQQLYDAVNDPLLRPALAAFFQDQKGKLTESLVHAVLMPIRDTLKESRLAGAVQANDDGFADLCAFAKQAMEKAKQ